MGEGFCGVETMTATGEAWRVRLGELLDGAEGRELTAGEWGAIGAIMPDATQRELGDRIRQIKTARLGRDDEPCHE